MVSNTHLTAENEIKLRAHALGEELAYSSPPATHPNGDFLYGAPGVTKRELFAAMAMAQLAPQYCQGGDFMEEGHVAKVAVLLADALLKELAK